MTSTFLAHHCLVPVAQQQEPHLYSQTVLYVQLRSLLGLCFNFEKLQKFSFLACIYTFPPLLRYKKEMHTPFRPSVPHLSTSTPHSLAKQRSSEIVEHVQIAKSTMVEQVLLGTQGLLPTSIKDTHDCSPEFMFLPDIREMIHGERSQAMYF